MHPVSVALSVMYPLIHPLPLSRLVLLSLFTEWGGRFTDYPVLIKSGWSSVSFDTSQPLSSPHIFLLWCSLGIAVLCMLRNGSRLGFRCSGLPLGSIPHWLISVSVQNDSCCCLWSSLGIFCLCSGCSKSTFGSSLALLLDFLLVAILFCSFSSLCWDSFSLIMHVVCLFH